ncbi:hypothetical protein SDC9_135494 [bioreactor metagenome]|uniref:Uncharacterized protein n=1 Tax=bioreactor metagenome TaxID=1076179 RepID=A0A645DGK8_9ZZZZ
MRFRKLAIVFIRGHHIDIKTIFVYSFGNGADHIISFITGHLQHWNIVCFNDLLDDGYRTFDIFRSRFALRFVGLILLVTESRTIRIESNRYMRRIFLLEHLLQGIHKPEDGGSVLTF